METQSAIPTDRQFDRTALLVIFAFLAFLLIFGGLFHPNETVVDAENEQHVDHIHDLREGGVVGDEYRPVIYHVIGIFLGDLLGDDFLAARLFSTFSAAVFVYSAYKLVSLLFGAAIGFFTLVGLVLNPTIVTHGLYVSTDMPFAGVALLSLYFAIMGVRDSDMREIAISGLLFGVANSIRYSGPLFGPTLLIALWWGTRGGLRENAKNLCAFAVCALVSMAPHFWIMVKTFGSPFYNEQWRVLVIKTYGETDPNYDVKNPFTGFWDFFSSSYVDFFSAGFSELGKFLDYKMVVLFGGDAFGVLASALLLISIIWFPRTRSGSKIAFLVLLPTFILVIGFYNQLRPRYLFPTLPVCYALIGNFLFSAGGLLESLRGRFKEKLFLALFFAASLVSVGQNLRDFVQSHPTEEYETALQLQETHGPNIVVCGTSFHIGRMVEYTYHDLPYADGREEVDPGMYYRRIAPFLLEREATHLLIGRMTMFNRPRALLWKGGNPGLPSFPTIESWTREAVVYRVDSVTLVSWVANLRRRNLKANAPPTVQ